MEEFLPLPLRLSASAMRKLEHMYVLHSAHARRLAYVLTGDEALADDLVHEAFVRIARRLTFGSDPHSFEAYLTTTMVNISRSHFGRSARERRAFLRHMASQPTEEETELQGHDQLWSALLALPIRQRAAVYLKYYEGCTNLEIADQLNCSSGSVKSLLFHALRALRLEGKGQQ